MSPRRPTDGAAQHIIRPARPGDLDELLVLYDQLEGEHGEGSSGAGPDAAAVLASILAERSRHLLVAEQSDGRVLGSADLLIVSNLTHGCRPWAIVENVIVSEDSRGLGVGRSLMQRVAEIATRQDCYKIQLLSRRERAGAHAFYGRLGYGAVAEGFRRYL